MKQTTSQIIFKKYDELRWMEFCIWLEENRDQLLKHGQQEVEYSHFNGSLKKQSSADYYRSNYDTMMDGTVIKKMWGDGHWIYRLYYMKKVIGDFISFEEAMHHAEANYDRATNTIKEN
jgi:hypothetical protein